MWVGVCVMGVGWVLSTPSTPSTGYATEFHRKSRYRTVAVTRWLDVAESVRTKQAKGFKPDSQSTNAGRVTTIGKQSNARSLHVFVLQTRVSRLQRHIWLNVHYQNQSNQCAYFTGSFQNNYSSVFQYISLQELK